MSINLIKQTSDAEGRHWIKETIKKTHFSLVK